MGLKTISGTLSGIPLDFDDPTPDMICLDDIANGVAKACRFNGQIEGFYSVGQHMVVGSRQIEDRELAKAFMLHDASEGYVADIVSPAKRLMPDYYAVEETLNEAIFARFNVDVGLLKHPLIIETDQRMLITERNAFQPTWRAVADAWAFFDGIEPFDIPLYPWDWQEARHAYLTRFIDLFGDPELIPIPAPDPRPLTLSQLVDTEVTA